ncbi:UNVERIFIED_CONTAM: hypothetical protein GTU68_060905, partial [Idotea baltica]|nr:hypothetical protein [Idotea baltica]
VVFSSHIFLFGFLAFALAFYYVTPARWQSLTLTLVSYVFYGWWNPWFLPLMLLSTVIDYLCGEAITKPGQSQRQRKVALWASIVSNLSILGFFKYAIFFAETTSWIASQWGWGVVEAPDFLTKIILPVGISFYTFQSMSYSIDLYRGDARPARNFIDFACYVSMFPQLVAGPIVRYASVADQLRERAHSVDGFVIGMTRFNYGFAKKILLANPAGSIADLCFEAGELSLTSGMAWFGVVAYAFQIYFDFSGYSDMAIGLGRMLGFKFPENFDSPYRSKSLTEFWRRWHISLSSFLRDYLYIPLGGNRKGAGRTYLNLMVVMLIGGLWHGAQWTFVIWGAVHGAGLAVERFFRVRKGFTFPRWVALPITFAVLLVTWVFFRSASLDSALAYLSAMFSFQEGTDSSATLAAVVFRPYYLFAMTVGAIVIWLVPTTQVWLKQVTAFKVVLGLILLIVSVRMMSLQGFNPFLYFQF